ncbi:MAG: M56 family metallopeptidase [Bacteroidales bacterium]|nr:M56 family metallopeptidase [Bacteroidales bacterium]
MVAVGQDVETLTSSVMIPWQLLLGVYLAGVLITLALFGRSALKTGRLIRRGKETEREGCRLVLLEDEIPSFSWGRRVVMNRNDLAENPAIFTHERMHVQCRHTLDLLLILPIQLLFWWNPLVWITREELRLLHEYQADEGVIQNGIDATQYQLLLVRKAVGEDRFTLASGFLHAKLKNRITMMLKPNSSSWMRWSYLALIPVLAAFMFACNPSRKAQEPEPAASEADVITLENDALSFEDVEIKPTFNGIDADEFARWVNSQLKYPEQAKQDGITGRVTLQFTIETDGSVTDVKVLQGVREDLDSESVRVVSASPKWEPGKHNGKPVKVTYRLPIVYQLR